MLSYKVWLESGSPKLLQFYGPREVNISSYLQKQANQLCTDLNKQIIVIDVNRNWDLTDLNPRIHMIRPPSKQILFEELAGLMDYFSPRLGAFIVDNLPLYFREYQGTMRKSDLNMRQYAASLSLLKRVSDKSYVIFSSYTKGVNVNKPFMSDISHYYCDRIYQVVYHNSYLLVPT